MIIIAPPVCRRFARILPVHVLRRSLTGLLLLVVCAGRQQAWVLVTRDRAGGPCAPNSDPDGFYALAENLPYSLRISVQAGGEQHEILRPRASGPAPLRFVHRVLVLQRRRSVDHRHPEGPHARHGRPAPLLRRFQQIWKKNRDHNSEVEQDSRGVFAESAILPPPGLPLVTQGRQIVAQEGFGLARKFILLLTGRV